MWNVIIILVLAPAIFAQTPVKSCGNGKLLPKAVYFGGKESFCTKPPCILKRGRTASTEVEFTSPINSKTVMPKAKAKVFGMPIDLNLGVQAASACNLLKRGCPLIRGDSTTFTLVKPVERSAMVGTADVEYSLVGDNNQIIFCYKLKTTVVWRCQHHIKSYEQINPMNKESNSLLARKKSYHILSRLNYFRRNCDFIFGVDLSHKVHENMFKLLTFLAHFMLNIQIMKRLCVNDPGLWLIHEFLWNEWNALFFNFYGWDLSRTFQVFFSKSINRCWLGRFQACSQ